MSNSSKAALILVFAAGSARAAAAPSAAAAPVPEMMEDTVATVNGQPILLSEFRKEAATSMDYWGKTNPGALADPANVRKIRESTLEELITRELLVQEAQREKMKVREREVDNAVEEIRARFKKDEATGRDLDEAEAEKAFDDQLKAEGIDYAQFRERLTRQIMAKKTIDENVKAKLVPPTEAETRAYFDKITAFIATGSSTAPAGMDDDAAAALLEAARQVKALSSERVRVQRILIRLSAGAPENERRRALKTAEDIKKRLDAGGDFAKIAADESEDPDSAARGGDIGYVLHGVASPELDKAAFSMDVGQTSDPILTENGYNIIRITEKRAAQAPEFDQFKDDLANFLGNIALHKKLDEYVKSLRDNAVIERHLPAS
ncbi:MAG TPA: peptidylprolyl isomerase [Elusimicrobiota bacterium]|jgi:parvulin-like peptidyl-prolyl isomerase|nr:peptidylprolyl isomerase [Elusimicrobiota bacterium]